MTNEPASTAGQLTEVGEHRAKMEYGKGLRKLSQAKVVFSARTV